MEKVRSVNQSQENRKNISWISNNPYTGIGSPEPLKYNLAEYWSRQIDKKNRIIYQVQEEEVTVIIIAAKGHYGEKWFERLSSYRG